MIATGNMNWNCFNNLSHCECLNCKTQAEEFKYLINTNKSNECEECSDQVLNNTTKSYFGNLLIQLCLTIL